MAIRQAKKAYSINEVPIGCVIVHEDKVIAKAYNRRNKDKSTLSHAEILAIKKACKKRSELPGDLSAFFLIFIDLPDDRLNKSDLRRFFHG